MLENPHTPNDSDLPSTPQPEQVDTVLLRTGKRVARDVTERTYEFLKALEQSNRVGLLIVYWECCERTGRFHAGNSVTDQLLGSEFVVLAHDGKTLHVPEPYASIVRASIVGRTSHDFEVVDPVQK